MKIGVLQINPLVGDIQGNARQIARAAREAGQAGADLCLTPETAILGYPPRDLLLYQSVVAEAVAAGHALALELKDGPPLLLGGVETNEGQGAPIYNCAFFMEGGKIRQTFRKTLLPSYDVFDETRYFEPSQNNGLLDLRGQKIAVTICEDAWNDKGFWPRRRYSRDPLEEAVALAPDIIVNLSASPFILGKQKLRESMLSAVAARHALPLVYCNQVGGNDDLVFDGRSAAYAPDGKLFARAGGFVEDLLLVDTDTLQGRISPDDFSVEGEAWRALVLGTRDYVRKSGFKSALLGLSGGIDSAVTAAVAAEALGPENVLGVLLPSPYSSEGSIKDSLELAKNLGIKTMTLPIEQIMRAFESTLAEPFAGRPKDIAEENIQSRIRGNLLMALSNKFGSLLLTTGNKSELAVGYCTIYGDMAGGFAVISDLPKTLVNRLARHVNSLGREIIPRTILDKPPSAELAPGQKDSDSLPPYELLDEILSLHIEQGLSGPEIIKLGLEKDLVHKVLRMVASAEFKRRQAAPGVKISPRSFGSGWRMPLASKRL